VQPGQHLVFGVGLAHLDIQAALLADVFAHLRQIGVRGQPVDVGLAAAQAPQVRAVQHVDLHAAASPHPLID
jgi:hypothetical protein